jgi:uncharacterized protein
MEGLALVLPKERQAELWASLSNQALHLCILPTEACNFRCEYCYESFEFGKMCHEVVAAIKRYLTRRVPDLRTLQVSWFGGEPLLAMDVIDDISSHILTLAADHKFMYGADMTSNAYLLTKRKFDRLCSLGVNSYQITFDGPQAEHDKRRALAGGRPTFGTIWANLVAIQQSKNAFSIRVRLHLHAGNIASIPEFIDDFARQFGGDSRFSLFIRPVSWLGGADDNRLSLLDHAEGVKLAERFCADCEKLGIAARSMTQGESAPICYASKLNSWVVRSNGRLNKCTVALASANNDVGRILPDGSFELDDGALRLWSRGIGSEVLEELSCPLRNFPAFRAS